jgi:hypothetical protein
VEKENEAKTDKKYCIKFSRYWKKIWIWDTHEVPAKEITMKKTLLKKLEELGERNRITIVKFPEKKLEKIKERFSLEVK